MISIIIFAAANSNTWIIGAEVVTAVIAVLTLMHALLQGYRHRKIERITEQQHQIDRQNELSGDYLKHSLDAFDELVRSLQGEITRMTEERSEFRKQAQESEHKLKIEIDKLRQEVLALRQILQSHGIIMPEIIK